MNWRNILIKRVLVSLALAERNVMAKISGVL